MGVLCDRPLTTPAALAADLSNEVSVDGRTRLLRNIMGLWVWQECRRDRLAEGLDADHGALAALAAAAPEGPLTLAAGAIDINHPDFLPPSVPGNRMLDRLRRHAAARGLACADDGALFRRITEALAAAYAACRTGLEEATGQSITRICLLGGGVRNRLLCDLTGQASGLPILVGSEEATALGNLTVQVRALGQAVAAARH
jgi:rhamnulokinase